MTRAYQRRHADQATFQERAAEQAFIVATDRAEDAPGAGDPGAPRG
ncbi:hypothetical protein QWY84_11885 [Aquisalimonas lutea]|nr:hypothetical protein [Aquisalimonas lutea]MDN3518314.1 hypothetical protein [Aquisalimonas lutea]